MPVSFQSLTTLREVPEDEFGFLGSLLELEELELGDIQHWNSEVRVCVCESECVCVRLSVAELE